MAETNTFGQRLRAKLSRLTLATKKSRKLLRKEPSTSSITPSSTTSTTRGSSPSSDENTTPRQPVFRQPSDVSWRSNLLRGGYNSKENKEFGSSRSLFHYTGHSTPATPTRGWSEDEDEDEDQRSRQSSAGHTPYVSTPGITPKASAASVLSGTVPVSILKKRSVDVLALSRQTSLCDKCKGETDTESAKSSLVEGGQPATVVSPVVEETQSAVLLATPAKEAPPATPTKEATPAVTLTEASPAPEPTKESTAALTALKIAMWPLPPTNKKKKPSAPRSPPRVTFTPETPEPPPTPPINLKSSAKPAPEALTSTPPQSSHLLSFTTYILDCDGTVDIRPLVSVAERIRQIELRSVVGVQHYFRPMRTANIDGASNPRTSKAHSMLEKPEVEFVFPLHVRRFQRRGSRGSILRPETPLQRSKVPDEGMYIHAPQPGRRVSVIPQPSESAPAPSPLMLDTSRGDNDPEIVVSGFGRRRSPSLTLASPAFQPSGRA
ncbi:hypothetical protein B0A48_02070 [Cryoendolithus antarcticus]|uniref:Uncharacterized protein n=1 Tax=Cryoendolithus antarcticus TaxID=1507870 RepID=A0A1V8TMX9_9PEZI|nr:hypothetical protein B0A48_02070 [Cryoendolithus antarcticus]